MRLLAMLLVLGVCGSLMAQTAPAPTGPLDTAAPTSDRFPDEWYTDPAQDPYHPLPPFNPENARTPAPVTPFSAVTMMSSEVSFAGHPPSIYGLPGATMRDSAGRYRTGEQIATYAVENGSIVLANNAVSQIEVNDPVAHCSFRWVEPARKDTDKLATVQCQPRSTTAPRPHEQATVQPDATEAKMTRQVAEITHPFPSQTLQIEPLGQKVVAGLKAFGIRQTLTDPNIYAGVPQVTEIWWSPEIKEILLAKPIGEPAGRYTIEMMDIKVQEPDPALFYPPVGYKIVPASQMPH